MALGARGELIFSRDLHCGYPERITTGAGVAAALVDRGDGVRVARFGVGQNASSNDDSLFRFPVKHLLDADATGASDGLTDWERSQVAIWFRVSDAAGILSETDEAQVLTLENGLGQGLANIRFDSAESAEIFLVGGTPATADVSHAGIDVTDGEHVLEAYFERNGTLRVWLDGTEISGHAGNTIDQVLGFVTIGLRARGGTGAGETPAVDIRGMAYAFGDHADPSTRLTLSTDGEDATPIGLLAFEDNRPDSVGVRVTDFPGRLGWSEQHVKLLWAVGTEWPGDGAASMTDLSQLTAAGLYTAHFRISDLVMDSDVMVKVVAQDAASSPSSTWTSGVYRTRTMSSAPEGSTLTRPADFWPLCCQKQYGRGQGTLGLIASNIDATRDTKVEFLEDPHYNDDREQPDEYEPLGATAPPERTSSVSSGSGIDVLSSFMTITDSPDWDAIARTVGFDLGIWSDHEVENNWSSGWDDDQTQIGGDFGTLTRQEMHERGIDHVTKVYQAGMEGTPPQGADPYAPGYRSWRLGPILTIWLDAFRMSDTDTMLGAAQKAWALDLLRSTDARWVRILSQKPMFDAVQKNLQDWDESQRPAWGAERDELLDAIESNASIHGAGVYCGDAHIQTYYPSPSAAHPKLLFEVCVGASSSSILTDQTLDTASTIAGIEATVTAGGRDGFVLPASSSGRELGDNTHLRQLLRERYATDGTLTLEFFTGDNDPRSLDYGLDSRLLESRSIQAWRTPRRRFAPDSGGDRG